MLVSKIEGVSPDSGASETFSHVSNSINPFIGLRLRADFVRKAHSVHAFVAPIFKFAAEGIRTAGFKYHGFRKSLIAFCHKFMNYGGENFFRRIRKTRWNQKKLHDRMAVSSKHFSRVVA